MSKLRQDVKDLGGELFKSNEKVTKLSVDCKTLLFNRDRLNQLVADQQKEIATLKDEQLRRAREREAYFRSFPFSEAGRALAGTYRERLIARYEISGAFVQQAAKVTSYFMGELCQKFDDINQSAGYPLDVDIQAVVGSIPRSIPDWRGDLNEAPDFEWWAGLWEEAATAEAAGLAGAPGAEYANAGDQEVVSAK